MKSMLNFGEQYNIYNHTLYDKFHLIIILLDLSSPQPKGENVSL